MLSPKLPHVVPALAATIALGLTGCGGDNGASSLPLPPQAVRAMAAAMAMAMRAWIGFGESIRPILQSG